MTAPTIDRLDVARTVARIADRLYVEHVTTQRCCTFGRLCRFGQDLLDAADDAGLRWERAHRRATERREAVS